jgi:hypothetical protein
MVLSLTTRFSSGRLAGGRLGYTGDHGTEQDDLKRVVTSRC